MRHDDSWPADPRLDQFRNSVWELCRNGRREAVLTCRVTPMRAFPLPWVKSEWLWYQVHWLTGRREGAQTDHGPDWPIVAGLEKGRFEHDDIRTIVFEAHRVTGPERDQLWKQYGPA